MSPKEHNWITSMCCASSITRIRLDREVFLLWKVKGVLMSSGIPDYDFLRRLLKLRVKSSICFLFIWRCLSFIPSSLHHVLPHVASIMFLCYSVDRGFLWGVCHLNIDAMCPFETFNHLTLCFYPHIVLMMEISTCAGGCCSIIDVLGWE